MSETGDGRRLILGLAGWLAISFVAGFVGAVASINAPDFYRELTRPEWAPPASVFGPVWTVLYAAMAIAAWLIWRNHNNSLRRIALTLFGVQLVLNSLWSWLFFAWQQGGMAFVDIVILWVLIVAMLGIFWRISRVAAALILPYLLWVSFASVLNWSIWQLNPNLLS